MLYLEADIPNLISRPLCVDFQNAQDILLDGSSSRTLNTSLPADPFCDLIRKTEDLRLLQTWSCTYLTLLTTKFINGVFVLSLDLLYTTYPLLQLGKCRLRRFPRLKAPLSTMRSLLTILTTMQSSIQLGLN